MGAQMSHKIFLIGLDAFSPKLVERWASEGKLPTLSTLIREGAWGYLESVPNMNSAAAWPTAFTGKNPGKHGCYWFTTPIPGSYKFRYTNGTDLKAKTVWQLLSERGKRVGVINVPMTYPAQAVNGFWISGIDAPGIDSKGFTYPDSLLETLVRHCGRYIHFSSAAELAAGGRMDEAITRLQEAIASRTCATLYLRKTYDPDFLVSVFMESDHAMHAFWKYFDPAHPLYEPNSKYRDVILGVYQQLDEAIRALVTDLPDDTIVMIMSDHGAGINTYGAIYLNDWLHSQGLLAYRRKSLYSIPKSLLLEWINKLYMYLLKKGAGLRSIQIVKELFPNLRGMIEAQMWYANIDWEHTLAFSDGIWDCIRINLAGREPLGIVQQGTEYEEVRERIIAGLSDCRDVVTGERVVDRVAKREDLYYGDYVVLAPDIEVKWKEGQVIHGLVKGAKPAFERSISLMNTVSGAHQSYGIFIAWGKPIRRGFKVTGMHIMDIAPTILYAMGEAVPVDMDGKVQHQIFEGKFVQVNPLQTCGSTTFFSPQTGIDYSEEEAQEVEKRLRSLGYLQ